jgi:hypothetical protein
MTLLSADRAAGACRRRRSWTVSPRGLLVRIAFVAVLLLLALPAGALGDTIHLEVSPANPPRGGIDNVNITASGSASSTEDEIYVGSPPVGEHCPQEYPEESDRVGWESPIEDGWHAMTIPSYNYGFFFTYDSRPVVCGYLTHFVYDPETLTGKLVAVASTELQIIYGPSEEEVAREVTKDREEKANHEHEQLDQELAAAGRKGEEERAAKAANEAAKAKYEAEAPARQAAKESAEAQAKKAAKELAERAPVNLLQVEAVRHPGDSSSNPGRTKIEVTTNAYAHVTIALSHRAGTLRFRASSTGEGRTDVAWSCNHPDLTYHYAVTVIGGSGAAVRRSGSFRTVSDAWCANTKKREAAEAAQEAREQARQPAKTAVVNELKRTYKIGSDDEEVHCNKVTTSRYKCSWSGDTVTAGGTFVSLSGEYRYCESPRGTALVVFYGDGTEVTISFSGRYNACDYPYS